MDKQQILIKLRQILSTRLSEEELRSLCFDLGVDYENLGGEGKAGRARNLIGYFDRRERLDDLIAGCRSSLPDLPWDGLLGGESQAGASSGASAKKVKILFLAAHPIGTPALRLDQEAREMDEALRKAEYRDHFGIVQQWALRVSDLESCLLRYKPDIVHFSGHGSPASEIILEDADGYSQAVPAEALSRLFGIFQEPVRCVVLNACFSEKQAQAIAGQIDCVIGMGKAVQDRSSLNFTAAFYQALGYGRDVQSAFDLGCLQIDLQKLAEGDIPRLLATKRDPRTVCFV